MSRAFRLGLFVVSALLILTTGVFLIGRRQLLFSSTYDLSATFKNVAGLITGADVRVGGVQRGTVKRIELPGQPDGDMTVVLRMDRSTDRVIRKDSVASIQTEGLLGDKYVDVSFGSEQAPRVRNGDRIAGAPTVDLSDLMKKAGDIVGSMQDGAAQLKEIGSKINHGEGTIGALVNDKQIYEQLSGASVQAKLGAAAFQENMEALKHNFFLRGFFNRRGYEDSAKLTQDAIAEVPRGPYDKRFTYDAAKLFASADSAKLTHEKVLSDAGRALESTPFGFAVVVARYGMKGDADDARVLTQARAMNVRDYLVNHFRMDDSRVKTLGLGKEEPVPDDAGTVDVLVYPVGARVPPALSAAARR
jgi:phospholipid/cholesterol/gamma-HCH transport system substrate-binding protein